MGQHRRSADRLESLVLALGPGPWLLDEVLGAGWTTGQVRRAVEAGRLVRPRRGVLAPQGISFAATARAALAAVGSTASISHTTAGTLRALWLPARADALVHLTVPGQADELRGGVRIHGCMLPSAQVEEVHGLRMTTPSRTAVDVARGCTFPEALMVLDSVARGELVRTAPDRGDQRRPAVREAATARARDLLAAAYADEWGWPGTVVVRQALGWVEAASESPLESRSRGHMILSGLPPAQLGAEVVGASGRHYWVDFLWADHAVIGEADGVGKYGGSESEVRAALRAERERQADLEAAGYRIVRWTSSEQTATWLLRLRLALGLA